MSALADARARTEEALDRLERVVSGRAAADPDDAQRLEQECEALRRECDTLRRALAAAEERASRLAALATQVEDRLEGTIHRLDQMTGDGATP